MTQRNVYVHDLLAKSLFDHAIREAARLALAADRCHPLDEAVEGLLAKSQAYQETAYSISSGCPSMSDQNYPVRKLVQEQMDRMVAEESEAKQRTPRFYSDRRMEASLEVAKALQNYSDALKRQAELYPEPQQDTEAAAYAVPDDASAPDHDGWYEMMAQEKTDGDLLALAKEIGLDQFVGRELVVNTVTRRIHIPAE